MSTDTPDQDGSTGPRIWVDADATPTAVKQMLFKAALRVQIEVVLVANQWLQTPKTRLVRAVQVARGLDVADDYIAQHVAPGDLVITQDIPLAAECVEKGATVIDNRGGVIDERNARTRLSMRDFMEEQRNLGVMGGGPSAFSAKDKNKFAGALDRWLAKNVQR